MSSPARPPCREPSVGMESQRHTARQLPGTTPRRTRTESVGVTRGGCASALGAHALAERARPAAVCQRERLVAEERALGRTERGRVLVVLPPRPGDGLPVRFDLVSLRADYSRAPTSIRVEGDEIERSGCGVPAAGHESLAVGRPLWIAVEACAWDDRDVGPVGVHRA